MTMRVITIEHPDTPSAHEGDIYHYTKFIPNLTVEQNVEYTMRHNWGVFDNGHRFYLYEIDIEPKDIPDVLHVVYPFSKDMPDRVERISTLNQFLVKNLGGSLNSQAMAFDDAVYFAILNYSVEIFEKILHMEPTPKH